MGRKLASQGEHLQLHLAENNNLSILVSYEEDAMILCVTSTGRDLKSRVDKDDMPSTVREIVKSIVRGDKDDIS